MHCHNSHKRAAQQISSQTCTEHWLLLTMLRYFACRGFGSYQKRRITRTLVLPRPYSNSTGKDTSEFSKYLALGSDENRRKPELLALSVNSSVDDWDKCGFSVTEGGAIDCGNMYIFVNQSDRIDEDQRTNITSLGWAGIDNFKEPQILSYDIQKVDENHTLDVTSLAHHPNFVSRIDHLVVRSNNTRLVKEEMENLGLVLAAKKSLYPGTTQLFFYCNDGGLLLEVFGPESADDNDLYERYIWGIAFETSDIFQTCTYFRGDVDTEVRNAVQPGRSIFTTKKLPKNLRNGLQFAFLTGSPRRAFSSVACRNTNEYSIPYSDLTSLFEKLESTNGRSDAVDLLSAFFSNLWQDGSSDTILQAAYMACNRIAPQYENMEMGVGPMVIKKAIIEAFGACTDVEEIDRLHKTYGDLGLVGEELHHQLYTVQSKNANSGSDVQPLTLDDVYIAFRTIAKTTGKNSQTHKVATIANLLKRCSSRVDIKFLIRSIERKLRIGVADKSILMALAKSVVMQEKCETSSVAKTRETETIDREHLQKLEIKEAQRVINAAFSKTPCFEVLIDALRACKGSVSCVEDICSLRPGIPLQPMLSRPATNPTNALEILRNQRGRCEMDSDNSNAEKIEIACEYKYDGERCQIHVFCSGKDINVQTFSRNLENTTDRFPDVVTMIKSVLASGKWKINRDDQSSFILDCEIVAFDPEANDILPFQTLSKRQRKNVDEHNISIHVLVIAFDLLYADGISLLDKPYKERRRTLDHIFCDIDGKFATSELDTISFCPNDTRNGDILMARIGQMVEEAINKKCEGLVLKDTLSTYSPSKRSSKWLKLKGDYMDTFGDTLDLIPIAAWKGQGKRHDVYGSFLCASYNPSSGKYETVCKLGSGFSDEKLKEIHQLFQSSAILPPPTESEGEANLTTFIPDKYVFAESSSMPIPDVWLEPNAVWEVKGATLSLSPVHTAGSGTVHEKKGIGMRFPRFIRERIDKSVENATTSQCIVGLYLNSPSS